MSAKCSGCGVRCGLSGAPIVTQAFGQRPRLVCKYHGWTYSHEGDLLAIRDPEDFRGLDFSCRGLKRIRCERFSNLIFVNFDENAPTLLEWLGSITDEWAEFQFDNCRRASMRSAFWLVIASISLASWMANPRSILS